jgi:predicted TIM-barrel fold metal-dependent hydrolase
MYDYPTAWPGEGGRETYRRFPQSGQDASSDPTGEKTIKKMDEHGIDKSVLLPLDFNLVGREATRMRGALAPRRSIEEVTERFANLQKTYPERFISFVGLDLRRGEKGLALLRKAIVEWGMKGLKLHSTSGFYLNDREYYPFYELATDLDIPVLVHCGFEFAPNRVKYADPIQMDDVAVDFPDLRIILAHMGGHAHGPAWHWRDTAISMSCVHKNVYMDMGDMQCVYVRDPNDFYQSVRRALNWAPDKLLYGTDGPWLDAVLGAGDYLDVLRHPDNSILEKAGVEFTEEEIDAVLGGNAVRALKLE